MVGGEAECVIRGRGDDDELGDLVALAVVPGLDRLVDWPAVHHSH